VGGAERCLPPGRELCVSSGTVHATETNSINDLRATLLYPIVRAFARHGVHSSGFVGLGTPSGDCGSVVTHLHRQVLFLPVGLRTLPVASFNQNQWPSLVFRSRSTVWHQPNVARVSSDHGCSACSAS